MQTSYFPASTQFKKPRKISPLPFDNQRESKMKGYKQKSTMDPGPINVAKGPMAMTMPSFDTTFYSSSHNGPFNSDWHVVNQKTFGNYLQFSNQNSEYTSTT